MPMSYFYTKPLEHWLTLCFLFNHAIRAKLRRANVHFLSKPVKDGTTGTVIVLTTPDAQRTMPAYQVSSSFADSSSFSELGRYAPIYTLLMLCLLIPPTLFRYLRVTTCVWKLNSSVSGFLWVFVSEPYAYWCALHLVKFPDLFCHGTVCSMNLEARTTVRF